VIVDRQPQQLGEQGLAHVGDDLVADIVHQIILPVVESALAHRDGEEREGQGQQQRLVLIDEDFVQHRLHEPCVGGGKGRHEPGADKGRDQPHLVRAEIPQQSSKSF
jgi:hypothetical protein